MKNLITRTLTGVVFLVVILGSIIWHPFAVLFVFFVLNVIALSEYANILSKKGVHIPPMSLIFLGSLVYLIIGLFSNSIIESKTLLLVLPLLFVFFMSSIFRDSDKTLEELAFKIIGIIYISIPFALFNVVENMGIVGQEGHNPLFLIMFFIIVWSNDTFAYLFGSAIGKHRLFERISPKKSWEGSIGGGISAIIIAVILSHYFSLLDPYIWILFALIIVVTSVIGDLFESLIKRQVGVKDSGYIMPGHGGVLDRFDAAIFAIPFYVAVLYFMS